MWLLHNGNNYIAVYGGKGKCGSEEGVYTEDLYINMENIKGVRQNLKCKIHEANCKISFDLAENGVGILNYQSLRVYVQEFLLK